MGFDQAYRDLQQGVMAPIYLVHGPETFLRRQFVRELRRQLGVASDETSLNYQHFEGADAESIVMSCNTSTFDGKPRLIVAEEPIAFNQSIPNEEQHWLDYLEEPNLRNCLCIVLEKVDKRRRLYTRFKEHDDGVIVTCDKPSGANLRNWIEATLKHYGKTINREALRMLAQYEGPLGVLDRELDKIRMYVGDRDEISPRDIAQVIALPQEQNIFKLVDAIGLGNASQAVGTLDAMLTQGADPLMILGMVARQIRILWQVKYEHERGQGERAMAKMLNQHPFVVSKGVRQSRNFAQHELERALEYILLTDLGIKKGRWTPELGLQRLVTVLASRNLDLDSILERTAFEI